MADLIRRRLRLALLCAGAIALLLGVVACQDDGELPPPASPPASIPPSSPTPTLDERTAEAWEEIQAKFDGFMEAWIKWAAEGWPGGFVDPASMELNEYAESRMHDQAMAALREEADRGHVRTGQPVWRDARLLGIDWDRTVQDLEVPEAVFEVCVDDHGWIKVDAETGEPVSAEPGSPHIWTVTAWWVENRDFGPDGWALADRTVDRSRPC